MARHRPKPGSGPRCHDGCGYFIASVTHRRTLPVPQFRCAIASKCRCYAAHHAEIALSKTAAETLCRLQSSIHHQLPCPAHHSRAPPRRQIAIDGHRPRRPARVPSLEAFGRRPSAATNSSVLRNRRCALRQRIRVSVTVCVALDLPAPLPTCGVAGPKITSDIASASSIPIGSSGAPNTRWKPLLVLAGLARSTTAVNSGASG